MRIADFRAGKSSHSRRVVLPGKRSPKTRCTQSKPVRLAEIRNPHSAIRNGCLVALVFCLVGTGPLGTGPARAQTTRPGEKVMEDLFGAELRAAAATASKADDLALAEKLVKSASTLSDSPDLRASLCRKACELAMGGPRGYVLAEQALDLLDKTLGTPDRAAQDRRLELYRQWYRTAAAQERKDVGTKLIDQLLAAGDARGAGGQWTEAVDLYRQCADLADYLRSPQKPAAAERLDRAALMLRAEQLEQRVRKEPDSAAPRTVLLRLLVVDLDDPNRARAALDAAAEESWRTYVPLAAAEARTLADNVCLELGGWYRTLALAAAGRGRANAATRALRYCRLYLAKRKAAGADAAAMRQAHQRVEGILRPLWGPGVPAVVAFDDPNAALAVERAVAFLWSQQQADGAWTVPSTARASQREQLAATALAAAALLEAGEPLSDARMGRALDWLAAQQTRDIRSLALLCDAFARAARQSAAQYARPLRLRADVLAAEAKGLLARRPSRQDVLTVVRGLGAAEHARLHAADAVWGACLKHLTDAQQADAGWAAPGAGAKADSDADSTLEAAAGLAACLSALYGPDVPRQLADRRAAPLKKALDFLADKLPSAGSAAGPRAADRMCDRLDTLARLGLLAGRRKIGPLDWYAAGIDLLLARQGPDGSWPAGTGPGRTVVIHTAQAVAFLVGGQRAADAATSPVATAGAPPPGDASARRAVLDEIAALKDKLSGEAAAAAARQIVLLYLLELGDPVTAAQFAAKAGDEELLDVVPLSARRIDALSERDCMLLGEWYRRQAASARPTGRLNALRAAEKYYARFAQLHTASDADQLKARQRLEEVRKSLAGGT